MSDAEDRGDIFVKKFWQKNLKFYSDGTDHSNYLQRDGDLYLEIPQWQHVPVELDNHLMNLYAKFGNSSFRRHIRPSLLTLENSELSLYMNTVLTPFLDTYIRNIQRSYDLMTSKILARIEDEIDKAVQQKNNIYKDLMNLADHLQVPVVCGEERRRAKTLASKHVAKIYSCTEEARASIAKMGKYAEEMISITKHRMQLALEGSTETLDVNVQQSSNQKQTDISSDIKELSRAAVVLGYELELSLSNARLHIEQSHEMLTTCSNKANKTTDYAVNELKDLLNQCVFA